MPGGLFIGYRLRFLWLRDLVDGKSGSREPAEVGILAEPELVEIEAFAAVVYLVGSLLVIVCVFLWLHDLVDEKSGSREPEEVGILAEPELEINAPWRKGHENGLKVSSLIETVEIKSK